MADAAGNVGELNEDQLGTDSNGANNARKRTREDSQTTDTHSFTEPTATATPSIDEPDDDDDDDDWAPIRPPPASLQAPPTILPTTKKKKKEPLPLTRSIVTEWELQHQRKEGASSSSSAASGPPKPPTALQQQHALQLSRLPSAQFYERSYMHRDHVTHLCLTPSQFLITGSRDGIVKFWKKVPQTIEFVKQYKAHLSSIISLCCDSGGVNAASIGSDGTIKIFDVIDFDLIHMIQIPYFPATAAWIHNKHSKPTLCVTSRDKNHLYFYHHDSNTAINIRQLTEEAPTNTEENTEIILSSDTDTSNPNGSQPPHSASSTTATPSSTSTSSTSFTSHAHPIHLLGYNGVHEVVVSVDTSGVMDYWSSTTFSFPTPPVIHFTSKLDTDLYCFVQAHVLPLSLSFSANGQLFVTLSNDRLLRIFRFSTGKIVKQYDDSLAICNTHQQSSNPVYRLDNIDFGRRMAVERDWEKQSKAQSLTSSMSNTQIAQMGPLPIPNAIFDESGTYLLYPTLIGIKVINIHTNVLVRVLGKMENTERFLTIALFQGIPSEVDTSAAAKQGAGLILATSNALDKVKAASNGVLDDSTKSLLEDPTLFCLSYKKDRFYWFSNREPEEDEPSDHQEPPLKAEATPTDSKQQPKPTKNKQQAKPLKATGRDVFNEKPLLSSAALARASAASAANQPSTAVLHTTMGDITLQLYPSLTPKTYENFTTHAARGYYNGTVFHRVIAEFMIQGGDPVGDGTGGESIWGGEFEDEIVAGLRHDGAGVVSMANAGRNSNGSQFFITTVPCPWLDGKHTVFGKVVAGMEVVTAIEKVRVKDTRPLMPVKIINIDVVKQ